MSTKTTFKKKWALFRRSEVTRKIASLDAEKDVQQIVHLMASYEFSWDIARALEVALFYTYGSDSVSKLLDRTGEFDKQGQKRYDDTAILIGHFVESGWDGEFGRRALERMNKTHGHYRIPNEDYLFVLWTFIHFPIQWTDDYGHRAMTAHEQQAWFNFWVEIGRRMGMTDLPANKADFDAFIADYEKVHFGFCEANHRVTEATVRIMENWLPGPVRPMVKPVVCCLMPDTFLQAVGYTPSPGWLQATVKAGLKLVGIVDRAIPVSGYPRLMANRKDRTYQNRYVIEEVQPERLKKYYDGKQAEKQKESREASEAGS